MIGLGGRNRKVAEAYVTQKKVGPHEYNTLRAS
jgi:hypothetical protein